MIDFKAMATAQNCDPALQRLRADSSLQMQAVPLAMSDITICPRVCRDPTFHPIFVAPFSIRSTVYRIPASELHNVL